MDQYLYIDLLCFIIALLIIIPLWNAFVINWKHDLQGKEKYWSRLWHGAGVIIRSLICLMAFRIFGSDWLIMSILAVVCYPVWNWVINYGMQIPGPKIFWYVGNTARADRINKRVIYSIYLILFVNLIITIILKS